MRKSGFTLIELLIALAIVSLIMAVGVVQYRDFARRQVVASVVRGVLSDLRYAQSSTDSGKKPTGCTGTLQGYSLKVNAGSYDVYATCGSTDYPVKTVNFPTGISISNPNPNPVTFIPVSKGTNVAPGPGTTINITSTVSNYADSITVTSTGEIK